MRGIKHLSKAVHSSLRSSVILFDVTRVVEELLYNSIDAGATKVFVFIGVGTCYVRVEDDAKFAGCGITRDGLELLGQRHATSKLHCLAEMDSTTGSFGFRGEALGSLSDVSLLEIISKGRGMPNGFRKVIKGCNCLYLGIDNNRQDVGTTVIVRDLFYNQPVRRKHMQSSPKKLLYAVKECVFRIALVHPQLSFKIIDIESEEEFLCTHPSQSPISLMTEGFGFEISNSLCKIHFYDGLLELSGYLSCPGATFSIKAFQYIYINSRCICKSPIHKLLNDLATAYCCLDLRKDEIKSQDVKRSRTQPYPAYILNLCCPRSSYDLTFEPSKTLVEFKEWPAILSFIEKAITPFWRKDIAQDELSGHDGSWNEGDKTASQAEDADASPNYEILKRKCRIQCCETSLCLSPSSSSLDMPSEEGDFFSYQKKQRGPSGKFHRNDTEIKGQESKIGFLHQNNCSLRDTNPVSWDDSIDECVPLISQGSGGHQWAPDIDLSPVRDNFFTNELTATVTSNEERECIGSRFGDESFTVDTNVSEGSMGSLKSCSDVDYRCVENDLFFLGCPKDHKKPFLQSCSLFGNLPSDKATFKNIDGFKVQVDGIKTKRKCHTTDEVIGFIDTDNCNYKFDFPQRNSWQNESSTACLSPSLVTKYVSTSELNMWPRNFVERRSCDRECLSQESVLPTGSVIQAGKLDLDHQSVKSSTRTNNHVLGANPWKLEHVTDEYEFERSFGPCRSSSSGEYGCREEKDIYEVFSYDTMQNGLLEEDCHDWCSANTAFDCEAYFSPKSDIVRFLRHGDHSEDAIFPKVGCSEKLDDEADWLRFDSSTTNNFTGPECLIPSPRYNVNDDSPRNWVGSQNQRQCHVRKTRKRSCSAPPFYRGKSKFFSLYNSLTATAGRPDAWTTHEFQTLPVSTEIMFPQQSFGVSQKHFESSATEDPIFYTRTCMKKVPDCTLTLNEMPKTEELEKSPCFHISNRCSVEDIPKELDNLNFSGIKWRNGSPQALDGEKSYNLHDLSNILDISSGFLHLAGDSLVPESITKDYLKDAKVLLQVDKKFIPIVAGETLAIIDQHAADERIRLEELRQKVLSGEGKTTAYLDSEQELELPEIGYQLLHNYAEQIQSWGWICNIHAQGSRSFSKNLNLLNRRKSVVTLIAVPCILGVNLSDVDLLEFLELLAETDGSTSIPPSVLRILNFKACRGAIMFGDSLLPSECSLIVEELKQTSLCFQCAHGRPTTVPLVNLEALHKQINKLGLLNEGPDELWHGLRRHRVSLERATQRLISKRGQY